MSRRVLTAVLAAGMAVSIVAWPGASVAATPCPRYRLIENGPRVMGSSINEVSGIEWSERRRVLWFHEDSDNLAQLFAITRSGIRKATMLVSNATNVDWEDMALAGGRLWIGDIGDNAVARAEVQVYVLPEPSLSATSVTAQVIHLHYEDGPHNAEALLVNAATGHLYFVTKQIAQPFADIYRADVSNLQNGMNRELSHVGRIDLGIVTAADMGPLGIVVKNYQQGRLYRWTPNHRIETAFRGQPCNVPVSDGESITFDSSRRLYAIPEGPQPRLYRSVPT